MCVSSSGILLLWTWRVAHSHITVLENRRRARRVYTTFFNPEGLQASLPRIEAIVRRHAAEYWEGKDQILGVPTAKEFAFTVAADLFMSMDNHDPLYRLFAQAHEEFVTGFFKIPIYLPGSAYRKALQGREEQRRIIGTIIDKRRGNQPSAWSAERDADRPLWKRQLYDRRRHQG